MSTRQTVLATLDRLIREETGAVVELTDATRLLADTGLDSLAFAVLVLDLEETLGYDPFTLSPEPIYPQTVEELVAVYERYATEGVT
jgi:acyl carrier protein